MQVFVNFGDPVLMTYIDVPSPTLWNHALFTQKDAYSSIVKVVYSYNSLRAKLKMSSL